MAIWDIFKAAPATPVNTVVKPNDPSILNPTVPGTGTTTNKDGTGPAAIPKAGEGEASPLDGFAKLWETSATDGKPVSLIPEINADPAKLMAAAKTIDFTKVLKPELLEKAAKGDAAALAEVVNTAAQAGYAQSAHATAAILKGALTEQARMFKDTVMPEILREHSSSQLLRADNPVFSNPAIAPLVGMFEDRLRIKYPNASAEELKKHSTEYFAGFTAEMVKASGGTIVKLGTTDGNPNSPKGVPAKQENWEKFFDVAQITPTS